MLLALVPAVFPLLAPSCTGELVVHVVDKDGKPVPGVQLALGSRFETHGPFPAPEMYYVLQTSESVTGIARFTGLERYIHAGSHDKPFIRLGVPSREPIEQLLDATKPPEELTFVVPECGSLALRLPNQRGTLQLRPAEPKDKPPSFWRQRMPPSVEYTGGAARVDHIGLGLELEYRVFSLDLPTELRGTLHGPAKPGELVTFTIPGFEGASELVAQLVDASLKPIAETQFDWSIGVSSGNSSGSSGGRSRSDAKGIVHIPLVGAHAAAGPRQLMLSAWSDPQSEKRVGGGYASLPLPPDFTHGSLDLGELILAPFGSPSRFARMDDEGLQRAFGGSTEGMNWRAGPDAGGPLEEMLAEMVRRGSASFETCITERLAAVRADKEQQHSQRIGELELLTALRRLQHKPDPLHLVLGSESVLDVAFPASPTVAFDLKNVEASESFEVAEGGSYRSGRFARCSVEAVGPDGKRLPPREWDSGMGGGMFSRKQLAPGETLGYGIPLADYVEFLAPGEYRVRIHYHDKEDIDSVKDLAGWIVSSSDEFVVHVQPLRIHVAQSRVDEMRGWIRAIDASKPVPLVSAHWHAGMEFRGEARDPEDKLFRAGFEAMPALLAAMDDPATEPERRAWVFGMLWNILGIEKPTGLQHYAAIGTMNWIGGWPTCTEDGQKRFGEFGTMAPTPVEAEKQRALAESWHRWSRAIEITIER